MIAKPENFTKTRTKPKEMINHPKHYNKGKYEVIDVIEDWELNFNLGNAVKYIGRADYKGNKVEDLRKAMWYIDREIERSIEDGTQGTV